VLKRQIVDVKILKAFHASKKYKSSLKIQKSTKDLQKSQKH